MGLNRQSMTYIAIWSSPSAGASSREDLPRTPEITQTYLRCSSAGALQTFAKPSNVRIVKSFLSHDRSWAYLSMLLISVCTVALGVWARLYHLGFPPSILWDEKYFPAMANKYLQGVYQFDLHPPLGKFIIAIGISLLGNEPLGWRIMPTLFGLPYCHSRQSSAGIASRRGSAPCCWPPSSPQRRYS